MRILTGVDDTMNEAPRPRKQASTVALPWDARCPIGGGSTDAISCPRESTPESTFRPIRPPVSRTITGTLHCSESGSPIGTMPISPNIHVVALEGSQYLVPTLDGATNPQTWTTVH